MHSLLGILYKYSYQEIDAALVLSTIWDRQAPDNVDYTHPIHDDFLQMICAYKYNGNFTDSDLMDAYLDFHWSYYVSLIPTFFLFIFIWKMFTVSAGTMFDTIKEQLEKSRLPSYWLMICAILDQDQFPDISPFFSILSLCVTVFFFVLFDCFMMNMMSADLVTIDEPAVIRSYQDAIDRKGLGLMFFNGWDDENFFRYAKKGTMESKIWEKRYEMPGVSMDSIMQVFQPVMDQKVVVLLRDWVGLTAANFGLTKLLDGGNTEMRALMTKDETGKFFTNAYMIQKDAHELLKNYFHDM